MFIYYLFRNLFVFFTVEDDKCQDYDVRHLLQLAASAIVFEYFNISYIFFVFPELQPFLFIFNANIFRIF